MIRSSQVVFLLCLLIPLLVNGQNSPEEPDLKQRRLELNRQVKEEWKNGRLNNALDLGSQLLKIEQKLFGDKSIRVAERYALLSQFALERNEVEQAKEFANAAVRIFQKSTSGESWQQAQADQLKQVVEVLIERPLTDRQELFGWERHLTIAQEERNAAAYLEAAENFTRVNREYFGERHPRAIMAMAHVQSALQWLGKSDEEATQLKRMRIELQQVEHPDHPNHAVILFLLADHALNRGDWQAAFDYAEESIHHFQKSGQTHGPTYVATQSIMGMVLASNGGYRSALPILRNSYALGKEEGVLEANVQAVADNFQFSLRQIAHKEWENRNWSAAKKLRQEARLVITEQWGDENYRAIDLSHDVATIDATSWSKEDWETYNETKTLHQQFYSQKQSGNIEQAVKTAQLRHAELAELFGADHAKTTEAKFDVLGLLTHPDVFTQQDQKKLFNQIIEFLRSIEENFGLGHPFYSDACMSFAEHADHFDEASQWRLDLVRKAEQGYLQAYPENSSIYIDTLTALGCLLANQLEESAVKHLERAIELWEANPERGNFPHCHAAATLGGLQYNLGNPYEARQRLAQAVDLIEQNSTDNLSYDLAVTLNFLGNIAGDFNRSEDAVEFYQKAITLFEKGVWNKSSQRYGTSLNDYTDTYQWTLYNASTHLEELREYEAAEGVLTQLIARFHKTSPREIYRDALYSLAVVYVQQGRHEEAQSLLKKVSEIVKKHFSTDPLTQGYFYLKRAQVSILSKRDDVRELLDLAFSEFQKIEDLDQIPRIEWGYFDISLLELRQYYEDIQDWNRVVDVREFAQSSEAVLYGDFPDTLLKLEAELKLARRIANLRGEDLKGYEQLLKDTESFQTPPEGGVPSALLERSDSLIQKTEQTIGPKNLAIMKYANAASTYFEDREQYPQASAARMLELTCGVTQLGIEHPALLSSLTAGCRMLRIIGQYEHAHQYAKLAVSAAEEIQGEESFDTFAARFELAHVYTDIEDYSTALPLARSASEGFQRLWGQENQEYANSLRLLGEIYYGIGEPEFAHREIVRSNEIIQRLKNVRERDRVRSAAALAVSTAINKNREGEARKLFENVIAKYESGGRNQTAEFFELLIEYGEALMRWGDTESAVPNFEAAVRGLQSRSSNFDLQQSALHQLGIAQRKNGTFELARRNLEAALELQQRLFGTESRAVGESCFQLAIVEHLLKENKSAFDDLEKSLRIRQAQLTETGQLLSDSSLTNLLSGEEQPLDLFFALLNSRDPSPAEIRKAFEWTIQLKGLSLDLTCRLKSLEHTNAFDSKTMVLIERLRVLNQELADITLQQENETSESELAVSLQQKRQEISLTQGELNERLRSESSTKIELGIDTDQLLSNLDPETAYIEFLKVNRFDDPNPAKQSFGYVAFSVSKLAGKIDIQLANLGDADEIDTLVEKLREQVERFPRMIRLSTEADQEERYRVIAQELHERLLGPFDQHMESSSNLIISPDAGIAKVPFAALVDESARYLIEAKDISYVSSARDLVRTLQPPGVGTLVISNPNFDAEIEERQLAINRRQGESQTLLAMRGSTEIDLRSLRWKRLPGAEAEAADVREILDSTGYDPVAIYTGDEAVEDVFKSVHAVRIVHLATHGFYVPSAEEDDFGFGFSRSTSGLSRLRSAENPLLRSGIVLAGANRSSTSTTSSKKLDDGWVTAQEIARLNFRNTELVVLSACESGLGDVSSGQGVHGIRRAFFNAGTHSILTTLFKVPDGETRELIQSFYKQLVVHSNRRTALCEAQREQIKKRRTENQGAHPFYWASFVLFGDID